MKGPKTLKGNKSYRGPSIDQTLKGSELINAKDLVNYSSHTNSVESKQVYLSKSGGVPPNKKADAFFPIDIPHKDHLFRLSLKEYDATFKELPTVMGHAIQNDSVDALIFAFDITQGKSFDRYLRRAIKEFIMVVENEADKQNSTRIPFLMVGLKKDMTSKSQVRKEEVSDLVRTMKEYIECELLYVSCTDCDDASLCLRTLFDVCCKFYELDEMAIEPREHMIQSQNQQQQNEDSEDEGSIFEA